MLSCLPLLAGLQELEGDYTSRNPEAAAQRRQAEQAAAKRKASDEAVDLAALGPTTESDARKRLRIDTWLAMLPASLEAARRQQAELDVAAEVAAAGASAATAPAGPDGIALFGQALMQAGREMMPTPLDQGELQLAASCLQQLLPAANCPCLPLLPLIAKRYCRLQPSALPLLPLLCAAAEEEEGYASDEGGAGGAAGPAADPAELVALAAAAASSHLNLDFLTDLPWEFEVGPSHGLVHARGDVMSAWLRDVVPLGAAPVR